MRIRSKETALIRQTLRVRASITMEALVDLDKFRRRLLALEDELRQRIEREVESARQTIDEQPAASDQSVVDELKEESFLLADNDRALLAQVRAALKRIEDGTFGRCVVDGGPIEEKRLEAVPWTQYCVKHQEQREQTAALHTPKL